MYISGKRVHKIDFIRDYGEVIVTSSECSVCGSMTSYKIRVCFDRGDDWDNTEEIDLCQDCLLDSAFFFDVEDLYDRMDNF